jgi:thiamine biosynthesis protein ThiS
MMTITLNGKPREISSGTQIEDLLSELRLDCQQVVVERNGEIVPRQQYSTQTLNDGDTLEVIHFVGGG